MEKAIYSESSSETETEEDEESEDQEDEEDTKKTAVSNKGSNKSKVQNKKSPPVKSPTGQKKISPPKVKEEKETKPISVKKKQPGRSSLLTGRGVTTQMLIDEQILDPGEKCLTINYLGRKFVGDLNTDGTIKCHNANQNFSSPSAWAMYCKKQVNPDKKSGCGWASVKYKGRKLDEFKSTWFRKQKIAQAVAASSEKDTVEYTSPMKIDIKSSKPTRSPAKGRLKSPLVKSPSQDRELPSGYVPPTQNYLTFSEALKAVQTGKPVNTFSRMAERSATLNTDTKMSVQANSQKPSSPGGYESSTVYHTSQQKVPRKRVNRTRISVKHSMIQPDSDPTTLVECAQFQSTGKIQPFSIAISTSALLLIDFHCHLTTVEVSGYLAGKWDASRQHLRVTKAYPCRYDDSFKEKDVEQVENEIYEDMESKGYVLLGWYHNHSFCQPDPSLNDIKSQLGYQKALKDGHYEPCVGLIVSPYDSYKKESQFNAFWVREPSESSPNQIGLPLSVRFTTHQDQVLTQDLINEMVSLVNFYRNTSDVVKFTEIWSADSSYLDKLKHSVIRKFPQDQTDGRFLDFIHKMLMAACS
ncbi:MPN domain-containing protein-like [Hydractinia symbiolongicarpus]|uniref:MPN domain-containing protein-like n=1 Tax=Hydractinia symbiolongicarpus TaxID=13093 RepID=UPI00254BC341|nr:MPN domain-containing protein-like [Hydractinia symbiolongicarpus]